MRNREITQLSLEELQQRWEWLLWERGCDKLRITENFKTGTRSFITTGLKMEFEDEYGFCHDCYKNEVLTENCSTLLLFLNENVISIILIPVENGYCQEILTFKDKQILIEKAS